MGMSTGTARAWGAWPVGPVVSSSRRPSPVSTTAVKKLRVLSVSTISGTCRSACRNTLSFIPRRMRTPLREGLMPLHQLRTLAFPQPPPLTLPQPHLNQAHLNQAHLTICHPQTAKLPAKTMHHHLQAPCLSVKKSLPYGRFSLCEVGYSKLAL